MHVPAHEELLTIHRVRLLDRMNNRFPADVLELNTLVPDKILEVRGVESAGRPDTSHLNEKLSIIQQETSNGNPVEPQVNLSKQPPHHAYETRTPL